MSILDKQCTKKSESKYLLSWLTPLSFERASSHASFCSLGYLYLKTKKKWLPMNGPLPLCVHLEC